MSKFIDPISALKRVVEDDQAPPKARWEVLQKIPHPPPCLLRRLFVKSAKRTIPVPSRLYALAALKYANEVELREEKKKWRPVVRAPRRMEREEEPGDGQPNALGI
jgi:hypothetical protein